jgi:hypothetical protein
LADKGTEEYKNRVFTPNKYTAVGINFNREMDTDLVYSKTNQSSFNGRTFGGLTLSKSFARPDNRFLKELSEIKHKMNARINSVKSKGSFGEQAFVWKDSLPSHAVKNEKPFRFVGTRVKPMDYEVSICTSVVNDDKHIFKTPERT